MSDGEFDLLVLFLFFSFIISICIGTIGIKLWKEWFNCPTHVRCPKCWPGDCMWEIEKTLIPFSVLISQELQNLKTYENSTRLLRENTNLESTHFSNVLHEIEIFKTTYNSCLITRGTDTDLIELKNGGFDFSTIETMLHQIRNQFFRSPYTDEPEAYRVAMEKLLMEIYRLNAVIAKHPFKRLYHVNCTKSV